MRNLGLYPLDDDDRLSVLRRLKEQASAKLTEMPIGDMTLVVLNDLIKTIEANKDS